MFDLYISLFATRAATTADRQIDTFLPFSRRQHAAWLLIRDNAVLSAFSAMADGLCVLQRGIFSNFSFHIILSRCCSVASYFDIHIALYDMPEAERP